MIGPGNFLLIDKDTTKLLQILAKFHPYGNKTVLKIILKFYIKLAKKSRKKGLDPMNVLEGINEKYLTSDYQGFELKKIKKVSRLIDEADGIGSPSPSKEGLGELKGLMDELRNSIKNIAAHQSQKLEDFVPRESAKLTKVEKKEGSSKSDELDELRSLMKGLQNSINYMAVRQRQGHETMEDFDVKDAAKLLKVEQSIAPKERQDYRNLRKQKHHRKIDF